MEGVGVRELTVLGEFKPFGLLAEAADGKEYTTPDPDGGEYSYFLFDPKRTRGRTLEGFSSSHPTYSSSSSTTIDPGDHEIFIRGNRLIWSSGSRVQRVFTCPNRIIMACWCKMENMPEAFICILQDDTLSMYSASGDVFSIPLTYTIVSIWPLPFGLLLQKSADGSPVLPFMSSGSPRNARDFSWRNRDHVSGQNKSASYNSHEIINKDDLCGESSHLILKHPLEELQAIFREERGKLGTMEDFDERTIWTCDIIPLLATYNKGKSKHSLWIIEVAHANSEAVSTCKVTHEPLQKQHYLRMIWQGKCSQFSAEKVFLATDSNGMPIICFLFQEQRNLLSLRLDVGEGIDEAFFDAKPQMSWTIPAIDAAPLIVTRPRAKMGILPFGDVIVLSSDNSLLLYTGEQCLCRYVLPTACLRGSSFLDADVSGVSSKPYNIRVLELANSVQGRINLLVSNGKIYRCALRSNIPSSLVDDCVNVMSLGLHPSFHNLFHVHFWGHQSSHAGLFADNEWGSFVEVMESICDQHRPNEVKIPESSPATAWEYLLSSKFHIGYRRDGFVSKQMTATSAPENVNPSVSSMVSEVCSDKLFNSQFLMESLDALHALYESLKLDILRKIDLDRLARLLYNIAAVLGETNYMDHYIRDFPSISVNIQGHNISKCRKNPPSIFRWLENCLRFGYFSADVTDLPPLLVKEGCPPLSWAQKIVSFYCILLGAGRDPNSLPSNMPCNIAKGSRSCVEESTVLAMAAEGFGLEEVDLLPAGISLPLRHALEKCRECPPSDWPVTAYILIGREDLALACLGSLNIKKEKIPQSVKRLISTSIPYKLHLEPVSIPSIYDVEKLNVVKVDSDTISSNLDDGMEHIFNSNMQLRYGRDLRLNEVRRLLCSAKPVAIHTASNPGSTDQDLQQHQLWNLAQRTTALPLGRGAFTLATSYALLTEALVVPKLVLAGRLPAQQNATVDLDPNIRNVSELKSWSEFHNGVAAGLRLAPFQGKISKSWIRYNKPGEPNDTHAGVLLALGLHGHLRVLLITDIVGYLQQQHDASTVGILLGMAASYRGTMHPAISKTVHLHIPSRFPSSFPELELQPLTQSAALMALGLLYEGSGHPQTMKVLMGEIGRRSAGDNVPEREGYAFAAGCALGLVALGRGQDTFGFGNSVVDRLFQYIGRGEETSMKLGLSIDEHSQGTCQVMDGTPFNVDVTAPGATISLALVYLKTESEVVATKLSIPTTNFELQYVRPDFLMLRIIAKNLILWNRICSSREWVEAQVPEMIKLRITMLDVDKEDNIDLETLIQAYVNIVTGACICIGLRYAGSRNAEAHDLLYGYAVYFLNEIKPICGTSYDFLPKGLFRYVDRGTLEKCLHLIVLSLSVVMAGSGNLKVLRLLRYLRNRSATDGHVHYGIQMAVSLAIGFLFLGGGTQTFSTRNSAIAALLITLYPRLPTGINDNRCHLQAFRHFYVMAAESRSLQTVDVDTGSPVYTPLEVTVAETKQYDETSFCEITPFSLPERVLLKTVRVCGPRYWPQVIELMPEDKSWWKCGDRNDPFSGGQLYVKRKVGACSYVDDPSGCQSLLSRAMHKITGSLGYSTSDKDSANGSTISRIDQLVTAFSSDPSLISFARHCFESLDNILDADFQEFCSQVIFECISKDRPTLIQVYLSMYASIGLMLEQVKYFRGSLHGSLFLLDLKVAVAYKEAVTCGRFSGNRQGIIQATFLESLGNRVEEILRCSQKLRPALLDYLRCGRWPADGDRATSLLLSCYLQWYGVPPSHSIKSALQKLSDVTSLPSVVPFLHLLMPRTHVKALADMDGLRTSFSI